MLWALDIKERKERKKTSESIVAIQTLARSDFIFGCSHSWQDLL